MALLPKVKLKVVPTFPSNIIGGVGIDATKDHGHVTIDMDWSEFGLQSAIPTSPTNNVLTYDTATNSYVMIPSSLLGGAVAGIADAPVDGFQYGRQSTVWTKVTAGDFVQAGTGASTRTMQNKARERVSVKDYGALGNGTGDDTPAFLKAIAYLESVEGGTVFIPRGTYNITSTLAPTKPIRFVGEGWGFSVTAFSSMAATTVTRLKWTGSTGPILFNFTNLFFGWGVADMEVDGNSSLFCAVLIQSCCGGSFERFSAVQFANFGLIMTSQYGTTSWNSFSHTNWSSTIDGTSCIDLDRTVGLGNVCHCTFTNTRINYVGGREGIYLGGCDNVVFTMTFVLGSPGSTSYGVYVDPSVQAGFPVENVFVHLETTGWFQPSTTTVSPATIFGMFQSTDPVLNGTPLVFERKEGVRLTPNSSLDMTSNAATVNTAADTRSVRLTLAGAQQINLVHASARYGAPITIIDLGNAPIGTKTIMPFAPDTINGVGAGITITNAHGVVKLLPNPAGTGWDIISRV